MRPELVIVAAAALDLVVGDPPWLPHPVRLIGAAAVRLETVTRRLVPARPAGMLTALLVVGWTGAVTLGVLRLAAWVHPLIADLAAVCIVTTGLAARDLARHSERVAQALTAGDLEAARRRVGMIVGRDTERLSASEAVRAAVESVAENTVDGVTAPLLFAVIGGPAGIMMYKAINTLDSTFGYRNERYAQFGWASARLDDVANWLPARLTAPVMVAAAALLGLRPVAAWRVMRRDHRRHASPNSGITEATVAGALGVQLGGAATYFGETVAKPTIGDATRELTPADIGVTNRLMLLTAVLLGALLLGVRAACGAIW